MWLGWPVPAAKAQAGATTAAIPDLAGIWDGRVSVRPANGETVPWAKTVAPGKTLPDGTKAGAAYASNFPDGIGIPSRASGSHGITNARLALPDGTPIGRATADN